MTRFLIFMLFLAAAPTRVFSQALFPPSPEPDDRYKADILLIVAHPDDEGMVIGYLAKAVLDEHKRVALVYGTRGDGGGNAVGLEQAAALGAEREIEARKAVASLGITNMTWLPAYSVGENHGDHQAAAVLATEAFDSAADPTVFPEQVATPADHTKDGNLTEGLQPWQAQKLYFFSDAANPTALDGKGPQYPWAEVSPSRGVTYGKLALESIANHRTQDYPGLMAAEALKKDDLGPLKQMRTRLVLGKSLVAGSTLGDVLEGTVPGSIAFKPIHGYEPELTNDLSAELGGPWAFYRRFWKAHDLLGVQQIFAPQMKAELSSEASIPVLIYNRTEHDAVVEVAVAAPTG